ncbi:hypothetical protein RHGRI_013230 [Rhododendron griersonianum]|uniref:Uncharacterized protein n=1 Tax=Rhododendron griersonianum TaxID=479676 RepID=A0AAV6K500_9ERIC|nr:hypothetical protein RHGRI_013230 [Rhododendron griersonianum]
MGSSYFGGTNPRNERSSSRKGKKSNSNAEYNNKPKQPQRGLGVAQLEQMRLHAQLASAYPTPALTQEDERMQTGYPMYTSPSSSSYGFHVPQNIMDLVQKRRNKGWSDSIDASSQNSQTIDNQELDLELRL